MNAHILKQTAFDHILRELWRDQDGPDAGLVPQDLDQWRARRERFNHLSRAVSEGFAERRRSGARGGVRFHAV